MLTTIAKRIQSRLSRTGIKVSLGDVKNQCQTIISDIDNPTEQELLAVQEYFTNNASELVVITNDIDTVHTASIQQENQQETVPLTTQIVESKQESNTLATTTKQELVTNTASQLGVILSESEIELIATNVNVSSDDLNESLEEIKTAIVAFIQHRIALNSQKIDDTLNEIVQVATEGFNANSQQLTDGLRNINQQLQEQSTDFKSKVISTLKCFQLPAAS